MKDVEQAAAIRGKTIRFVWTEGPTKGKTHEHVFHPDGTVTWSDADASEAASPKEKPPYAANRITDDIYAVSYLAPSGYTLTVVLNFGDQHWWASPRVPKTGIRCEAPSRWSSSV